MRVPEGFPLCTFVSFMVHAFYPTANGSFFRDEILPAVGSGSSSEVASV
jgi:hypothetical protein